MRRDTGGLLRWRYAWALGTRCSDVRGDLLHGALLIGAGIRISMAGKGAWRDNVFADAALRVVERIWKSVKNEEVSLRAYTGVSDARASIARDLAFHNGRETAPKSSGAALTCEISALNALRALPRERVSPWREAEFLPAEA